MTSSVNGSGRGARLRGALRWSAVGAGSALLLVIFAPEGRLRCIEPYLSETSPDRQWTVTVCRRPMVFAMPGGGSDAPGWIVLRDRQGAIRSVSEIAMVQLYGATFGVDTEWTQARVRRLMVFDMPLDPAANGFDRWWGERMWRLRALAGLTPSDDEQH